MTVMWKYVDIIQRPELAWLDDRGGQLLIFGDVGNPENFAYGIIPTFKHHKNGF